MPTSSPSFVGVLANENLDKRELPANAKVDFFINVLLELFIPGILKYGLRYDFPLNLSCMQVNKIEFA